MRRCDAVRILALQVGFFTDAPYPHITASWEVLRLTSWPLLLLVVYKGDTLLLCYFAGSFLGVKHSTQARVACPDAIDAM